MSSTKLYELLNSLDKEEYKQLGDFLKSPFFNKSKRLARLYELFKKNEEKYIDKTQIHNFLYPGEIYEDDRTRLAISDFVKLIEHFIVTKAVLSDSVKQDIILAKELRKRNAEKCFSSILSKLNNLLEGSVCKDGEDYLQLADLLIDKTIFLNTNKLNFAETEKLYTEVLSIIDNYYIFTKLQLRNCLIQNQYQLKGHKTYFWLDNEVTEYIENNLPDIKQNHKLIFLNYLIFDLYTGWKKYDFINEISVFLKENFKGIAPEGLIYIYNTINHYYIYLAEPRDENTKQRFDLIMLFDSIGYFTKQKLLDGSTFYNVINTSLNAGEKDFAMSFYNKYLSKISVQVRDDIGKLALSTILFYEKNFGQCLSHLSCINLHNHQFYLKAKTMQISSYYELDEYILIYENIDAFRHYLKRHYSMLGNNSFRYTRFCNYVIMLVKINELGEITKPSIMERISKDDVVSRNWLLEKISDLENKFGKGKK